MEVPFFSFSCTRMTDTKYSWVLKILIYGQIMSFAVKVTESQNGSVIEESDESRDQDDLWKSLKDFVG